MREGERCTGEGATTCKGEGDSLEANVRGRDVEVLAPLISANYASEI